MAVVALLLVWLAWLPMPFGSVTDAAQPALILPPLLICAAAALLRFRQPMLAPRALKVWGAGALAFALVVAAQLLPLPDFLLRPLSPESYRIWSDAARIAAMALQSPQPAVHPITVDPATTSAHLFRLLAYAATFIASALLLDRHRRRYALVIVLSLAAVFEATYGVREAALHRYAIWGWVNTLIFNRVTGTFVNPNHFAHYAAIVLPMALYIAAAAWHDAAPRTAPLRYRIVRLVETKLIPFGFGFVAAFACMTAILVAQSRGALLSAVAGLALVAAISSGRRHAVRRAALIVVAAAMMVALIVYVAGAQRTLGRLRGITSGEAAALGGRGDDMRAAFAIWELFPIFGSGLGTFADVVSITGIGTPELVINHAHNDYAEIAATTGALGLIASLVPFLAGIFALARSAFRPRGPELSWSRQAFQVAALASLLIAMIHALVDFNFFIPANPATLAAIAGAAVAVTVPR